VHARAELRVAAPSGDNRSGSGCRAVWVRDAPPLAFRATPEAVYLVGTAASPVGDDDVFLHVVVGPGATLVMRSAAAIAWASTGSTLAIEVEIEDGGALDWHLHPLVASSGCHYSQHSRIGLAADACLNWTEEVVLGRHGEGPGDLDMRLDVDVASVPLLRHQLVFGPRAPGWDAAAVMGDNRAVGLVLVAGAGRLPAAGGAGAGRAIMALDGPGVLAQAVGRDLPSMRAALGGFV